MAECVPNRKLIAELMEKEEKRLENETPKSYELYQRAIKHMPMGVASTYHARDPYPIYFTHGKGPHIWSVEGKEIVDFHNGYGCMVQGHAHPLIVEAIQKRAPLGTQFGLPTEDAIIMAEHLAGAFKLPQWRFVNSGSEATMDAIRVARAFTGRETIVKMFGSYHGHHDYVMVSIGALDYGKIGPRDNYASLPYGGGIPQGSIDMTIPVPFNDIENMTKRIESLIEQGNPPACVIMEPAMMNLGVVLPEPGFLEAVRELTKKHGIVLIFDEVKVGICTARGGAVERWGVLPDMVTLGKAIAGGTPCGAIGGTEEIMAKVNDGTVFQVGTYRGNPLSMAAARASWEQVMTDDAYAHLNDAERPDHRQVRRRLRRSTTSPATPSASRPRAASTSPSARSPTTSRSSRSRTPISSPWRGCTTSTAASSSPPAAKRSGRSPSRTPTRTSTSSSTRSRTSSATSPPEADRGRAGRRERRRPMNAEGAGGLPAARPFVVLTPARAVRAPAGPASAGRPGAAGVRPVDHVVEQLADLGPDAVAVRLELARRPRRATAARP